MQIETVVRQTLFDRITSRYRINFLVARHDGRNKTFRSDRRHLFAFHLYSFYFCFSVKKNTPKVSNSILSRTLCANVELIKFSGGHLKKNSAVFEKKFKREKKSANPTYCYLLSNRYQKNKTKKSHVIITQYCINLCLDKISLFMLNR